MNEQTDNQQWPAHLRALCGGQEPHRQDFTPDMLPEGYRPLALDENHQPKDEVCIAGHWTELGAYGGKTAADMNHCRTRRHIASPAPASAEQPDAADEDEVAFGHAIRKWCKANPGKDFPINVGPFFWDEGFARGREQAAAELAQVRAERDNLLAQREQYEGWHRWREGLWRVTHGDNHDAEWAGEVDALTETRTQRDAALAQVEKMRREMEGLLSAGLAVEKWWLEDGMHKFHGAPNCIFRLRSTIARAALKPEEKPSGLWKDEEAG